MNMFFKRMVLCAILGAVASNEVKMKLQEFVLSKKQRDMHGSNLSNSPPQFRTW